VRGGQKDNLGIGMVGAWPIVFVPKGVAGSSPRRADIRMRIVSVNTPCLQYPIRVAFVAGPPNVVDDFVDAAALE